MRTRRHLLWIVAVVGVIAFALVGHAQEKKAEPAKKAEAKVRQIAGEVSGIDAKAKTITVKGKDTEVTLDAAGIKDLEKIKVGDKVSVAYSEADGKKVAKSVRPAKKVESKAAPKKEEAKPAEKPGAPGYK